MRGFQVLACLAFFGTCAGKQLTIPSPRKQGAVDATAREVSQEQGFAGPHGRHLQDASCEAYSVSGSKSQSERHGTYVASGTCDGKTLYECVDCSSSTNQYLFYYTPHKDWKIGENGCGDPTAGLATFDDPDPASTQWMEWSNSGWVESPTISVTCVTTPATCESYTVSGGQQTYRMGTYVASGECDGETMYKCKDCSSSLEQYLYYSSKYDDWNIGKEGCGSTVVGLHTAGSSKGDLGLAQWKESVDSEFVDTPTISVQCDCVPSYVVSGADHQTTMMGTYVASGTCEGKTLYKCEDCSYSGNELYYNAQRQKWYIGDNGCGSTVVGLYGSGSGHPGLVTQWTEWSSSEGWVKTPTISVERSCAAEGARGLNFAAIVGEAASELFTQNIAFMLVIVMLCGAVVAFLHFPRKQPRKNADETPLLQGGEVL